MVARTGSGNRSSRISGGGAGVVVGSGRNIHNNNSSSSASKERSSYGTKQQPQPQPHHHPAQKPQLTVVVNNPNNSDVPAPRFSPYPKIDQSILNMKSSLGRFTRANDRRMVLRTLKDVKYLRALPIDPRPPPMVDLQELELEVAKESLVLNGQTFHRKTKYGRTATDFLHVLHELCYQLCESASCPSTASIMNVNNNRNNNNNNSDDAASSMNMTLSPDTLYYDMLCRLARTITSADCFAKLNEILGSHELILMNSSAERKPKIKKAGKPGASPSDVAPTQVNIFEEGGNIHAHIVTTLGYGLYRKLDVNTGRPWIKMQVELNERMNFSSSSQVRHVTIHWPDMYV